MRGGCRVDEREDEARRGDVKRYEEKSGVRKKIRVSCIENDRRDEGS